MRKITVISVFGVMMSFSNLLMAESGNLAPNPGFEEVENEKISSWIQGKRILKGEIRASKEIKHSGNQSLYIKSVSENLNPNAKPYGALAVSSDYLLCPPPGSIIKCSMWVKTKDVISPGKWFKCRSTIYFFDKDKNKLKHYDFVSTEGTLDWKKYSTEATVPKDTASMKIGCSLTHCKGEAWFDDIEIKINENSLQRKKAMINLPTGKPILIPTPWKTNFKDKKITIGSVLLKTKPEDKIVNPALEKILKEHNVVVGKDNAIQIICADKSDNTIDQLFKREFPDNNWNELGTQGYFLNAEKNKIILAANTEQGRFYALQTLRQLLKNGAGKEIEVVSIIDKPTVDRRGVVIGLQWFREKEEAVRRMASLKMNFVWHQGSFMNLKLGCSHKTLKTFWREPFTEKELDVIRTYLELCRKSFIDVCISFSPRGLPQTHYSSEKDIDILVSKMEQLYQVGVRNLGINFDDLQNIEQNKLFYKDDIEKFDNDFAKGHAYFVDNVYKKLKAKCPEVNFTVLPYPYGSITKLPEKGDYSKQYLKTFGKNISPDIKIWVVCLYTQEDIDESKKITGRKPFIWDNYYTTGRLPAFPAPINRPHGLNNNTISGYMILPAMPIYEDASKISWLNTADYEWSPARYNPEESYKRAIAFVAGSKEATKLLQEYSEFSLKIDDYNFPTASKEKRLAFLNKTLVKLESFPARLKILPEKLANALKKDIEKYQTNLKRIADNLQHRSYPAVIHKKEGFTPSNENVLTNFIPLKKGESIEDTKAWLTYDDKNLYIKCICNEPKTGNLVAKRKKHDSNVFQDDSIELFIMPEAEDASGHSAYYQIVINSIKTVYDSKFIHKRFNYLKDQFKDWTTNLDIKTSVGSNSWTLEVAIPFKDLGMMAPEKGRRIFVNICRSRYAQKKGEYSCYSMLLKGKFHDPLSFWPMEFR